jgi:TM2 domain-containing membrane protein YozV
MPEETPQSPAPQPQEPQPPAAPPQQQAPPPPAGGQIPGADRKLIAGLLGILIGSLGIHKFYLGYQKEGIIMLVVSLVGGFFTCGAVTAAMGIIGLVEGILYLTKTDEEFVATYITNQKPWF